MMLLMTLATVAAVGKGCVVRNGGGGLGEGVCFNSVKRIDLLRESRAVRETDRIYRYVDDRYPIVGHAVYCRTDGWRIDRWEFG